ncbi:MAG: hypothetical protein IPI10_19350 [Bacteroidetes bacterium]|nr:hypothetical protein [Bacteroidota bacterium]
MKPFQTVKISIGFGEENNWVFLSRVKKYISTTVVVFKDLNGNHKLNQNEEGVTDMLVNIRPISLK